MHCTYQLAILDDGAAAHECVNNGTTKIIFYKLYPNSISKSVFLPFKFIFGVTVNIQINFSRNPKIAAFLHEYDYVQEFGEGVDRMYQEMEKAGLPSPEYRDIAFMLNATIRNSIDSKGAASGTSGATSGTSGAASTKNDSTITIQAELSSNEFLVYQFIKANPESSTRIITDNITLSKRTVQRCIAVLLKKGIIENKGTRQRVKWIILK